MGTKVDASTIGAGQFFSTANFSIPDFQRDYSWDVDGEVADFWADLEFAIDSPPYFLGLVIVTDEGGGKTVVDGQQRILTLSLLANAIRRAAIRREKSLVADTMRDVFLFGVDYAKERRVPRVSSASGRDNGTLEYLLRRDEGVPAPAVMNMKLVEAQQFLDVRVEAHVASGDASSRLGRWAHFLTNGITFALFEHPDRNAAYKVFEVVNARGRELTPAQLIKSYVIGSTTEKPTIRAYERWSRLEDAFFELGATSQFTLFVRNVITLRHGYVEARDLYQAILDNYEGANGSDRLLTELESEYDWYMSILSPPADDPDAVIRALIILDTLNLRTVRPTFLALRRSADPSAAAEELLKVIVPRLAMGTFGTGSVERRFAEAARAMWRSATPGEVVAQLSDLKPSKQDFEERVASHQLSKPVLHVLRASILQGTRIPSLDAHLHHVRPRNAVDWDGFGDDEYAESGGLIGNYLLATVERRPRGTNTPTEAFQRLVANAPPYESAKLLASRTWTAQDAEMESKRMAKVAGNVWYD